MSFTCLAFGRALFTPQPGSEVLVDFIDGDIDHPLIVGQWHNGPHELPWPAGGDAGTNHSGSVAGWHHPHLDGQGANQWVVDDATAAAAIACASRYFKHPGYTAEFDEKVADWAEINNAAIVKASDQTSALKRARQHQHDSDGREHQRTMPRQFHASWAFWTEHHAALTGRADVLTAIRKEGVA